MKKFLGVFLSGLGLGFLLASLVAPQIISWYFEPPVEIGVNCKPAVEWALQKLVYVQWFSGPIIAVLGSVIYFFVKKRSAS